jgi:hypothetical protein
MGVNRERGGLGVHCTRFAAADAGGFQRLPRSNDQRSRGIDDNDRECSKIAMIRGDYGREACV